MCGIFGYVGKLDKAGEIVLSGLKKLEYRGYDSWGVAVKSETQNSILVKKKTGKINHATVEDLPKSTLALGHTRWATHGAVINENAHPHTDCTKRFAIVHNGIIENYQEIKKNLAQKHHFRSETDTEILLHLIEELAIKLPGSEAVRKAFTRARGLNAIVVLDALENKIYTAKTGSPIVLTVKGQNSYLASDSASLLAFSNELLFLNDGEMAILSSGKITLQNIADGKTLLPHFQKVDWKFEESEMGKYPHFMIKEIEEQPKILLNISANLAESAEKIAAFIKNKNVYFSGCGTAYFAALAGSYYLMSLAKKRSLAVYANEPILVKNLTDDDVLLALSQSGETIDLIETVKMVQAEGAKVVGVVNVLGSTLFRMANEKVLLGAGPEICVLATKSFTAKLGFLTLLSYALSGNLKVGQRLLAQAAEALDTIFSQKQKIKALAKKLVKKQHIFVIGRGLSYPMALESALKIKEVTYLHAEGFAAGELKHGVIALIEKGTPCVVLALNDENYESTIASAMELKARGGYIVGISPKNNEIFDDYLPTSDVGVATNILQIAWAQLLSYYMALELKLDPDKPRNLAKSVTVK
ncbi:glutamine--fructose-6-phosphate transaminase (isomerizing) [Candidatus Gottesmanbacteria bacterium]|nr:glutamine--fructose-6-phosphate transaminase (isomerizing) [Candidatus Gottesmanbacteria bacterium]